MAFFKKVKQKINGKWYPQSVTVGKPVTTRSLVSDNIFWEEWAGKTSTRSNYK